jgi:hypothetical protein
MVEGDPYYAGAKMKRYWNRTDRMIADIQTQYNIAMTTDKLEGLGYFCTENEEAVVNTDEGQIQMVFEGS